MSPDDKPDTGGEPILPLRQPKPERPAKKRGVAWRIGRGAAWIIIGGLALLIVVVGGLAWYTTTGDFQRRVGREIVSVLGDATGGRVELESVKFNLWHLAVEVDGLVIHGLEGPDQAPYLSVDKVRLQIGISSFFSHASGTGLKSHVRLKLLQAEHPQFHLIVYKDGTTNQPVPKHPKTSKEPVEDTLLDLRAKEADVMNGVALVNDRKIPFDIAARNLSAQVQYLKASDSYGVKVSLDDLQTKMKNEPVAQSKLSIQAELGRDAVTVKSLEFDSGNDSVLHATASLTHFAQPAWQFAANGTLELKQVAVLTATKGLTGGTLDLALNGHSCAAAPAVVQKPRRSWLHLGRTAKTTAAPTAPAPECMAGYVISGSAKLHRVGYSIDNLHLRDVDGGTRLHITPNELLLTDMVGILPGGGSASGDLRIEDWLAPAPTAAMPRGGPVSHAYLKATVNAIPLRTIMQATETKGYGDLGFDTAVTGPVNVEWGGPVKDISDTVVVEGDLKFRPTGVTRPGALDNIPMTGEAVARYDGKREVVNIQHAVLLTPESSTEASGVLGVNRGDALTDLKVDMTVRDLGEFDQLLHTLKFEANGKQGTAAVPVVLHGAVTFQGTAMGRAANLDLKGHVQGSDIEVKLGSELDTQIDSVVADAEFSYEGGLLVADSTIKRGTAVLNVAGSMKPRREVGRRGLTSYAWDKGTGVNATVQLAKASVADLLQIAGQQQKIPLTGTIAMSAKVSGTLDDLDGSGRVSLSKGVAYGEPYDSASANLVIQDHSFDASQVAVSLHGARITANGGYDWQTRRLHGHIEGDNLVLSKFQTFAKARPSVDATLTVTADANGTLEQPGLKASAKLAKVKVDGNVLGNVSAEVHSEASTLFYTAQSMLVGAKVEASGQTRLTGDYDTQAKLDFSGLDLGTVIPLVSSSNIKAQSSMAGQITVSGPLKTPVDLGGTAEVNNVDVKLEGVELKSAGPLRASLKNGLATLAPLHITGEDTDVQASGTVQAFGGTGKSNRRIDLKANGSVSMAIVHTLDSDILSSGKVEFTIAAGGELAKPALTGRVQFDNVNMAMDGVPNGLSALNGTLVFNEDRLQVENLTAMTGGGKLKIGGFLTYRNGLYASLTATGDVVRVRMYGLSVTTNTNLTLQGTTQNLLLSGNVLITRFGVGPNVDFAAFSSVDQLSVPPEPNAPSNKISLDVHITSSPQLDFQNSFAKLAGTVDLTVRGTVAEPSILGRIQITEGSATFAGTKYELQRGDIYFNNPVRIDPIIDIDATARVENYDITIGLQGTMSNLKPTYRSEPPLSEADIFALLALGRTQEEAQLYQEQQVQQGSNPTTNALLGGALNETVSNRVGKLFGGGTVKIDPAFVGTLGNSTARITVQKQLSRQLSVTFATNVNTTAEQLLEAQYDLTPNVSIVVERDESGVFSVVYKIRRRYR